MGAWVQGVGEQLGVQLGQIIAESLQRSLESSINVADIALTVGILTLASWTSSEAASCVCAVCSTALA